MPAANPPRVPWIDLEQFEVPPEALALLPRDLALRHRVLPVNRAGSTMIVAMSDPQNSRAIADVKQATGLEVAVVQAADSVLRHALARYYPAIH